MKKIISAILLFSLILAVCICAAGCVSEDGSQTTQKKWHYADIVGTGTSDTQVSPVDDFHVAVNKEWLSTTKIPQGETDWGTLAEMNKNLQNRFVELLKNESVTGREADLLKTYYRAFMDMDKRNQDGIKPLEKYTKEIEELKSLDDYRKSIVANKIDLILISSPMVDLFNPAVNTLAVQPFTLSLSDPAEYTELTSTGKLTKDADGVFFKKMLMRLGYTAEQAEKMNEDRLWLETELASALRPNAEKTNGAEFINKFSKTLSVAELKSLLPNYPVDESLAGYLRNGLKSVYVSEPEGLKKLNELYTEENLDKFKAYLLYMYITNIAQYLDQETLDLIDEKVSSKNGIKFTRNIESDAISSINQILEIPAQKFYVENTVNPQTKEDVVSIIRSVIDIYRDRLVKADWLSNETRTKAIEKLDSMKIFALYPDTWSTESYDTLSFDGCESLMDMANAAALSLLEAKYRVPGTPVDKNKWPSGIQYTTLQPNAFYLPSYNAMLILAGIVQPPLYDPSTSVEENLAGLGYIIGHEISHAFDSSGSMFDKDGNIANWWTADDRKAFDAKTQKVADYFSTIEMAPGVYVDGNKTILEAVADLGGMSVMLEAASHIDGFDYEAFFKNYGRVWKKLMTEDTLKFYRQLDTHPPGMARTNAVVQQFAEFYDTFNVKPGDGMYLAPEDRLSVW